MKINLIILNGIARLEDNEIVLKYLKNKNELVVGLYYWPEFYEENLKLTGLKRIGTNRREFYINQCKRLKEKLEDNNIGFLFCKGKENLLNNLKELNKKYENISLIRGRKNIGDIKEINDEINNVVSSLKIEKINLIIEKEYTNFLYYLHEQYIRNCILNNKVIEYRNDFIKDTLIFDKLNNKLLYYIKYKQEEYDIINKYKKEEISEKKLLIIELNKLNILNKEFLQNIFYKNNLFKDDPYEQLTDWINEGYGFIFYKKNRNLMDTKSTKLSPYIAFGSISQISILYNVYLINMLLKSKDRVNSFKSIDEIKLLKNQFNTNIKIITECLINKIEENNISNEIIEESFIKFIEELGDSSFNEFYIYNFINKKLNPSIYNLYEDCKKNKNNLNSLLKYNNDAVEVILKELIDTGYISNRSRMILCNVSFKYDSLRIDYRYLLELFEHYLIDYIKASTYYGVLWSIGVFDSLSLNNNNSIYTRLFSINKYVDENREYINNKLNKNIKYNNLFDKDSEKKEFLMEI